MSFVKLNLLWNFTHISQSLSSHIKQYRFASTSSPSLLQASHSLSPVIFAILLTLSLVGKSFAQLLGVTEMFSDGIKSRQRGQRNPTGAILDLHEDCIWVDKHSQQNEWEHGRHFGDLNSSRQMGHFIKS